MTLSDCETFRQNGVSANHVLDLNLDIVNVIRHQANRFLTSHVFYVPVMDTKENFVHVRVRILFGIDRL